MQSTSTIWGGIALNQGHGISFTGTDAVALGSTASLRLLSGSVADGGNVVPGIMPVPITGTATSLLRIDRSVALLASGATTVRTTPVVWRAMPRLAATDGTAGGSLTAAADVPAGHAAVLLLGLMGPPLLLPGVDDAFWLDPVAHIFQAFGVTLPGQPLTSVVAVPLAPSLLGFRLGWQAVSLDPASGAMQVSNPQISMVL